MKLFQNSPRRPRAQASSLPRNPPPMMVMDFTWREIDSSRLKSSILRKSVTRSWKSSPTPLRLGNVLGRPPVIKRTSGFIFHSLPSSKNESTLPSDSGTWNTTLRYYLAMERDHSVSPFRIWIHHRSFRLQANHFRQIHHTKCAKFTCSDQTLVVSDGHAVVQVSLAIRDVQLDNAVSRDDGHSAVLLGNQISRWAVKFVLLVEQTGKRTKMSTFRHF